MIYLHEGGCPQRESMWSWDPLEDPEKHAFSWKELYIMRGGDNEEEVPTEREPGVWVVDSTGNEKCFSEADQFHQKDGSLEVRKGRSVVGVYAPGEWRSADLVDADEEDE